MAKSFSQAAFLKPVLRWLVLLVIAMGMLLSALGMANSHGWTDAASAQSVRVFAEPLIDHDHDHAHVVMQGTAADKFLAADKLINTEHSHHAVDHSHDSTQTLLPGWGSVLAMQASWREMPKHWLVLGRAYRLDRPPMA